MIEYSNEIQRLTTIAANIKDKVKEIAENKNITIENGVDTILTILEKINQNVGEPIYVSELTASTDEEMQSYLIEENIGKVVKFIGTSSTYETDTYYLIGE